MPIGISSANRGASDAPIITAAILSPCSMACCIRRSAKSHELAPDATAASSAADHGAVYALNAVGLFIQCCPEVRSDDRRILIDSKRDRALEAMRASNEHFEPAAQWIGSNPSLMLCREV